MISFVDCSDAVIQWFHCTVRPCFNIPLIRLSVFTQSPYAFCLVRIFTFGIFDANGKIIIFTYNSRMRERNFLTLKSKNKNIRNIAGASVCIQKLPLTLDNFSILNNFRFI